MNIPFYYFSENRFLFNRFPPRVSGRDLHQFVQSVNHEAHGITDLRQFSDCTAVNDVSHLSTHCIQHCTAVEEKRPESKLAILVSESLVVYGLSRAYQMLAEDNRKEIRIFKQRHEALIWLSDSVHDLDVIQSSINVVMNENRSG